MKFLSFVNAVRLSAIIGGVYPAPKDAINKVLEIVKAHLGPDLSGQGTALVFGTGAPGTVPNLVEALFLPGVMPWDVPAEALVQYARGIDATVLLTFGFGIKTPFQEFEKAEEIGRAMLDNFRGGVFYLFDAEAVQLNYSPDRDPARINAIDVLKEMNSDPLAGILRMIQGGAGPEVDCDTCPSRDTCDLPMRKVNRTAAKSGKSNGAIKGRKRGSIFDEV